MAEPMHDPELSGIIPALKDWSFERFVTISLVKFIYILGLIILALSFVVLVFTSLTRGVGTGLIGLLIATIGFGLGVLWLRVSMEMVVVVFRIADNTTVLARQARGEAVHTDHVM